MASAGPWLSNRLKLILLSDQTALTATTFANLLSGTIVTQGNSIIEIIGGATVSNSTSTAVNRFRVTIGGTVYALGGTAQDGGLGSTPSLAQSLTLIGDTGGAGSGIPTPLAAGTYTVNVDYLVSAGTMSIRGAANTNGENLVVIVREMPL